MHKLIGECPNVIPSGLGNGTSTMDMSSFLGGSASEPAEIEETYKGNSPAHTPQGVE